MQDGPSLFFRYRYAAMLGMICIFYLFNAITYLRAQSVTTDENAFYLYAKQWARGDPERRSMRSDSKSPLVAFNLMPRAIAQIIHPGLRKTDNGESDIVNGRYVSLIFSIFVILLTYRWAREMYGMAAGLSAAFLVSFEPTFLANSALVTTDGYATFFLLAVMYCFWKTLIHRNTAWLLLLSISTAVGVLAKQSLVHLYVLLPAMGVLFVWVTKATPRFARILQWIGIFVLIQWIVINLGFYFRGSNEWLGDYYFMSRFFSGVQHLLPARLPVPLPHAFLQGLDMAKFTDEVGGGFYAKSGFGKVTILGKSFQGRGIWYYYIVALFFKTPIAYLIGLVWAFLANLRRSVTPPAGWICLGSPVFYFLTLFSLFFSVQIGVRHIVFLPPFVAIFIGSLLPLVRAKSPRLVLVGLALYLVGSVLVYWRHYYSYTNEFISDKTFAFRYVGASNIDYNQGNRFAKKYLAEHPEVQMAAGPPRAGHFLISVGTYMDLYNLHAMDWLTRWPPYGHVAFSNLLINVPADSATSILIR